MTETQQPARQLRCGASDNDGPEARTATGSAVTFTIEEFDAGERLLTSIIGLVLNLTAEGQGPRDVTLLDVVARNRDGLLSMVVAPWSGESGELTDLKITVPWDEVEKIHIY